MSRSTRSHLTRAALLCSVIVLAPLAMADTPAPAGAPTQPAATPAPAPAAVPTRDESRARRHADHEAFFSARLAALHAGLQLKPDQEALWTPVETAIRGFGKLRAARWADRRASMYGQGSDRQGPDRQGKDGAGASDAGKGDVGAGEDTTNVLRKQADRLIARGNAMKSLADATGPLLAGLDADQKGRLPILLDGLAPRRVLARAFAIEDRRDDRQAGREHEGLGRGMRHEHWAERGMREHDGMMDRRTERFDRDDDGRGFEHGHRHRGWDGERAERDGMRGEQDMQGEEDMRGAEDSSGERNPGRGDRPMRHHLDRDQDEPDRT